MRGFRGSVSCCLPLLAGHFLVTAACEQLSTATEQGSGFAGGTTASEDDRAASPQTPGASEGATPAAGGLPPEVEEVVDFERPAAGRRYVYSANPVGDSVAVIDSSTLAIESVEAGDTPKFLQTLSGRDQALVLNIGSSDATIVRTSESGSVTSTVDVVPDSNAIAVAPDGNHAVVYFDARLPGTQRSGSFQDISVITLSASGDCSTGMTVGFKPSSVSFRDDGEVAYVVTEAGVSVIDFPEVEARGAHIARTVSLGEAAGPTALDVSVTNDGKYALLRRQGASLLSLVELDGGERHDLDLAAFLPELPGVPEADVDAGVATEPEIDAGPEGAGVDGGSAEDAGVPPPAGDGGVSDSDAAVPDASFFAPVQAQEITTLPVTDLDLDTSSSFAIAVVRALDLAYRLDIPQSFTTGAEPQQLSVPGELIGSAVITPDGTKVILFTTVDLQNERATIVSFDDGEQRTVELRKAIRTIAVAPDSRTALVIHAPVGGSPDEPGLDADTRIDRSFGYSVVDLEDGFAKLEITSTPIGPFSVVPDGTALFALFDGTTSTGAAVREVQRVGLDDFLVSSIELGSSPVAIGSIEASRRVFVGQDHPDGRISFIDWRTSAIESVTGFELNSRIRE